MLPAPEGRQTKARLPSRGAPLSISLCRPAGAGESRGYPSTPRLTPWATLCRSSGPAFALILIWTGLGYDLRAALVERRCRF